MTIQFTPLGIPVSSSHATTVDYAQNVLSVQSSASLVQYALFPVGPTGSHYKVASGSKVIVSNV